MKKILFSILVFSILVFGLLLPSGLLAGTYTPNHNFYKMDYGEQISTWWTKQNNNWDTVDKYLSSIMDAGAYPSINAAVNACGNKTIVVTSPMTLTANLIVPSGCSLRIEKGGYIVKASTFKVTINGNFEAGLYTVFSGFTAGDVTFGSGSVKEVYPQWWGTGTDVVNSAIAACPTYGKVLITQSFTCSAITGKADIIVEGISGRTTNTLPQTLKYNNTIGDFTVLGTDGGAPVAGMTFRNLALDGNGTTGAVIAMAAWRSHIDRCYIRNAAEGITYYATTSWAGENSIERSFINSITNKAINNENISYGADGVIKDNWIFPGGTHGIYLNNVIGWEITGNHIYSTSGYQIYASGYLANIHDNLIDNVGGGGTGIYFEQISNSQSSQIRNNFITLASDNATGIHVLSTGTMRVTVALNQISESGTRSGLTGIKTTGASTFYGTIALNNMLNMDTEYSLHSAATTELITFKGGKLLTSAPTIGLYTPDGSTPTLEIMSGTSATPEGAVTANPGSLYLCYQGNIGRLWLKETGTGNTGWVAFYTLKASNKGITGARPILTVDDVGYLYLDTTLVANGQPIWWNGTIWVDSAGVAK